VLEYSGSDVVIERVTCSKPLQKDLILEVLTVGNVYPPQVRQYILATGQTVHTSLRSDSTYSPQVRQYIPATSQTVQNLHRSYNTPAAGQTVHTYFWSDQKRFIYRLLTRHGCLPVWLVAA
jgi:hypothetical protein